jgi:hypothetical protein
MFQYQYQLQYYKYYRPLLPLHPHQTIMYPLQHLTYNNRKTGRVKFFNASKGYGFIIPINTKEQDEKSFQAYSNRSVSKDTNNCNNHNQEDDAPEGMS